MYLNFACSSKRLANVFFSFALSLSSLSLSRSLSFSHSVSFAHSLSPALALSLHCRFWRNDRRVIGSLNLILIKHFATNYFKLTAFVFLLLVLWTDVRTFVCMTIKREREKKTTSKFNLHRIKKQTGKKSVSKNNPQWCETNLFLAVAFFSICQMLSNSKSECRHQKRSVVCQWNMHIAYGECKTAPDHLKWFALAFWMLGFFVLFRC